MTRRQRPTPPAPPDPFAVATGDALAVLPAWPAGHFDAVVTDPPYCSGGMTRGDRMQSTTAKYVQSGYGGLHADFNGDTRDQRGFFVWSVEWLRECLRLTRPGGACAVFTDWRQLPTLTDAMQVAGWVWRGIAVWDKGEGCRPQMGRFRSQVEYLVFATNGPQPADLSAAIGVIPGVCHSPVLKDDKHHITGKPTRMMEWAVRVCPAGGRVLDPFCGSGTTGVACARTGRGFAGVELNPPFAAQSAARIAAARRAVASIPVVTLRMMARRPGRRRAVA